VDELVGEVAVVGEGAGDAVTGVVEGGGEGLAETGGRVQAEHATRAMHSTHHAFRRTIATPCVTLLS